jgi:hypothetical protein
MGAKAVRQKEVRMLRIFISYASEDLEIAHAIAIALARALPEGFSEIYFDKWSLHAGEEFRNQIKAKLEKSDILIIVSTGVQKDAYAFPSWEVGFFEGVRKRDPNRKMIPMYLDKPPADTAGFQGFDLQIPLGLLPQSIEQFSAHNEVQYDDGLCVLVREWQEQAEQIKRDAGRSSDTPYHRQDALSCVKSMREAIFRHMKSKIQEVAKPQKQITIESTRTAILASDTNLPLNARLIPTGGTSMSIFGLSEKEMSWEEFLQAAAGPYLDSWREAITSVVISSMAGSINVDNSQIILSVDEAKAYRIVLTTAIKYWDDRRAFSLYFVETLSRPDYGDTDTTLLLKGLQVVCRYRFLFLESTSIFSAENLMQTRDENFPDLAAKLLRELNLMRQESRGAGLDQPAFWSRFVDWGHIRDMSDAVRPREDKIYELAGRVLKTKDEPKTLAALRVELSEVVRALEDATRVSNSIILKEMANKLLALVKAENSVPGSK